MFWINLKIGFRNLLKYKVFSFINIFGLALSMSVCLLIISMILGLSEYDRFHNNYDRIYRILSKRENHTGLKATSPMPVRYSLLEEYSGIDKIVTFKRGFGGDASYNDRSVPLFGFFCSEELFDVFSFELTQGNTDNALKEPFSVILTKESARKLFGDINPLGEIIRFDERGLVLAGIPNKNKSTYLGDYTVKGIIDDIPGKTHLEFDILASMSSLPVLEAQGLENALRTDWKNIDGVYSYVLLNNDKDQAYLESILNDIGEQRYAQFEDFTVSMVAQPLAKITPGKMYGNPISYRLPITAIYFLAFLAIIVILTACLNYTNLSMARSLSRAKEVGIRKVSGAYRYQILAQFIGESVLVSVLSLLFAIGILELLKPAYNALWITQYFKVNFADNLMIYFVFFIFSLFVGILAGALPAMYLSSFKPLKVLREVSGIKMFKKITLRKTLIVVQFSISLFFIITTTLIYFQLRHLVDAEYGFDKEQIVNVPLHGNEFKSYANVITGHTGILGVSGSSVVLATGGTTSTAVRETGNIEDSLMVSQMSADVNFIENLGLDLIAGKGLPEIISENSEQSFLVNETAARKLGFENVHDIIGQSFLLGNLDKPLTVRGVLSDFHFSNLMSKIGPFIIRYIPDDFRYANIKIDPVHQEKVMTFMESEWKKIDDDHPFEPEFMEHQLEESNAFLGDIGYVVGFISIIAISIASLGLLGMVIFVTQTRVKEIGIRKVHGAHTKDIILLLSRGFIFMLIIAVFIAAPLAKLINNAWLIQFAVRVNFGFEVISIGILIMLFLGIATILSQTVRTARINTSEILRCE